MTDIKLGIIIGASTTAKFASVFKSASKNSEVLGKSIAKTNAKFKASKDLIKYKNILGQLKAKQLAAGGSSIRLAKGISAVEKRYAEAKREARQYGIQVGSVIQANKKLGLSLAKLERQQRRINLASKSKSKLGNMKAGAAGLIGGVYAASRLVSSAVEHEQASVRLSTVVDSESLEKSIAHARKYAQTHIGSANEMINIQYALNSAGLGAQASMIGSEIVEKVAKVTNGSAEGVGEVVGVVFNNMANSLEGNTKEKLQRIGDLLTKTQLKFQIRDFGQLGESFAKGAKGAVKYKVALDQTATVLGTLNTLGIQGSLAGTSFNAILRQMGKSAAALGFEIERLDNGDMDLIKTIENLNNSMSDTTDIDERAMIIQDNFGDEGGAISLLLDNLDKLKSGYKDVRDNSAGVVDKNYAKFLRSTAGQMGVLGNNVRMLGYSFVDSLFPTLNMVLKPMAMVARWLADGLRKFPVITQLVGAVAAAFAVYGVGVGAVTAATWLWNAALLANPIGLVVAGLVVGATLIYKYWTPISDFFSNIWLGIKGAFGAFIAFWIKGVRLVTSVLPDAVLPAGFRAGLDSAIDKYSKLGDAKSAVDGVINDDSISKKSSSKTAIAATVAAALVTNVAVADNQKTQQITVPQIIIQASNNPIDTANAVQAAIAETARKADVSFDEIGI